MDLSRETGLERVNALTGEANVDVPLAALRLVSSTAKLVLFMTKRRKERSADREDPSRMYA